MAFKLCYLRIKKIISIKQFFLQKGFGQYIGKFIHPKSVTDNVLNYVMLQY